MKVKDVIISASRLAGREDVAEALGADRELSAESRETAKTLLYCFNAVEDELARYYFPLKFVQELSSDDGIYPYSDFLLRPVKILSVKHGGRDAEYERFASHFKCGYATVTVEYEYSPGRKTMEDESSFDESTVSVGLAACGAAAEYCLICGEMQAAELWQNRYRAEIDRAQKKLAAPLSVPPRRWV